MNRQAQRQAERVGHQMALSAIMLAPMVVYSGNLIALSAETAGLSALILLMGIVGASSVFLAFHLVAQAGAVFASQSAYAMTIAGIVWGMLLLNEEFSAIAWGAVIMILIGLYLVEPDTSGEKIVLKRSFARRGNPTTRDDNLSLETFTRACTSIRAVTDGPLQECV